MTNAPASPPTSPPAARPAAATPGPTRRTGPSAFVRRHRIWFAVGAAFVLALLVAVWANQGNQRYGDPLDPQNPDPDGAQALAQVLEDEGVEVVVARTADELDAAGAGDDTTVLVTGTAQLAPSTLRRLDRATRGADVMLVDPPGYVLEEIDEGVTASRAADETTGSCPDGRVDDLGLTVDTATGYTTRAGCFPSGDGFVLGYGADGTSYFGAGEALTNDQVLRGDNAAIALRLLGAHDRLVWYLPTYDDAADDEAVSLWSFAPDWLVPSLVLVLCSTVVLIWWRGRRMGRLATEPLPVVVRAVETTRSRGRMYRRADDRGYAAAALRTAARRRLADHLRLGRSASDAEVVSAVARHLGRTEEQVRAVVAADAAVPSTDQGLVQLAQELTQLMKEVRRG